MGTLSGAGVSICALLGHIWGGRKQAFSAYSRDTLARVPSSMWGCEIYAIRG